MIDFNDALAVRPLARRVAHLEAAMRAAKTPQLSSSSLEDGSVDEYDGAGNLTSQFGKQFDGGHGVVVVSDPEPPTPTMAIVSGARLSLTAQWDGFFVDADGVLDTSIMAPTYFSRVEVHASVDPLFTAEFADTIIGTIESPRGGTVTISPEAQTYYVRLVARSKSGKRSEASPAVPVEVELLVDMDIALAELDAAHTRILNAEQILLESGELLGTKLDNQAIQDGEARLAAAEETLSDTFELADEALFTTPDPPDGGTPGKSLWVRGGKVYERIEDVA